jgi:5'-3' exonuclease
MERLMLLDGNGLIYRGYFALPPLTTSKGELVNAVFGFCSIVLRGIQDLHPDYVAVAFDLQGPTFRHEQYAEYKATRQRMPDDLRDQFPKVREVVKALRIPVYELPGYEADDVIGTIVVDAERRGLDTTIVTGDLDMLQLVTDQTRLMTTRSGVENTIIYDPARIRERFDLVPAQMIDYKALKGDPTDNIPGVPGVGEKTAAKLIREFGTLESLYARLDEVKPDKLRDKLAEHRDQVFLGKDLSTIVRDLPVEFDLEAARLGDYDRETVIRLFREYEFRTLIERLPPMTGETAGDAAEALRGVATDGSVPAARVAGSARPSAGVLAARPVRRRSGGPSCRSTSMPCRVRRRPPRTAAPQPCRRVAGRRCPNPGREPIFSGRARGGHRRPVADSGRRWQSGRRTRAMARRPIRRRRWLLSTIATAPCSSRWRGCGRSDGRGRARTTACAACSRGSGRRSGTRSPLLVRRSATTGAPPRRYATRS